MLTKIMTSADRAQEQGFRTGRELAFSMAARFGFKWNGKVDSDHPVHARIDFGRWMADCHCGTSFYVDPSDPVFFCPNCGNSPHGGALLPVIFPEDRDAIEAELLLRRVQEPFGMKAVDTALNSLCIIPGLARCWNPGETVEGLRMQRIQAGG